MKERPNFLSGNSGLQVGMVQPSSQCVAEQLGERLHCLLPAGLGLDRQAQRCEMLSPGPAGRIDELVDGSGKLDVSIDLV